jgi:hypothetical protein
MKIATIEKSKPPIEPAAKANQKTSCCPPQTNGSKPMIVKTSFSLSKITIELLLIRLLLK